MKVHCFRNFLLPLLGLSIWVGIVCLPRFQSVEASPELRAATSADGESSDGGDDTESGDNALPTAYLLEEARNAAEQHDFVIAEALYQTVLLRERQNLSAILELAAVYEKTGKLEYARGLLLRASVLRPHDEKIIALNKEISDLLSTVLIEEVDSLIARRQCDLALPKLSMLLTIEPENPDLYFKKAVCHLAIGKPKTALIHINDALRLQKNVEYYNLHADITKRIEQDEISELVAKATSLLRNDTPADRERALQIIGEILQKDPEHKWARRSFVILSKGEAPSGDLISAAGMETGARGEANEDPGKSGQRIGGIAAVIRDWRILPVLIFFVAAFILAIFAIGKFRKTPQVHPLSGRFSHFSLREILNLLSSTSRTGVLHIASKFIDGEIYFKNGEVYHCKTGKLTGSEALSTLVNKIRAGSFQFLDCALPPKRTIESHSPPDTAPKSDPPVIHSDGTAPAKSRRPKSRMKELLDSKR